MEVIDARTGDRRPPIATGLHAVTALCWAGDRMLVAGTAAGGISAWDADSGERAAGFLGHAGAIQSLGVDPSGTQLVSASADGTARLWSLHDTDAPHDERRPWLEGVPPEAATAAPLRVRSPDGAPEARVDARGRLHLHDASSGERLVELVGHRGLVQGLAFDPSGTRLLSRARDGTARLWSVEDLPTEPAAPTRRAHGVLLARGFLSDEAWSPCGTLVATGGAGGEVRLWNAGTGQLLRVFPGRGPAVSALAFAPGSDRLLAGTVHGGAVIWDLSARGGRWSLSGHTAAMIGAAFSADGARIATTARDRTLRLWDAG